MALVTLLVFAVVLAGGMVLVSRGMKVPVAGGGLALLLVGAVIPWRMGDGQMASLSYVSAKAAGAKDAKFSLIFDAVGDGKMSILPPLTLIVMIGAALLLVYALTASMRRRDPEETAGPMIAAVMSGLCLALMIPMSIMSYRELRHIHGLLDSPAGFAGYLVFLTGVLMSFFGTIMIAKGLPSVPARTWPHREF
jgi:hypothetical protein